MDAWSPQSSSGWMVRAEFTTQNGQQRGKQTAQSARISAGKNEQEQKSAHSSAGPKSKQRAATTPRPRSVLTRKRRTQPRDVGAARTTKVPTKPETRRRSRAGGDQRKPHFSSSRFEPGPPPPSGRGRNAAHKLRKRAGDVTRFWLGRSVARRLPSHATTTEAGRAIPAEAKNYRCCAYGRRSKHNLFSTRCSNGIVRHRIAIKSGWRLSGITWSRLRPGFWRTVIRWHTAACCRVGHPIQGTISPRSSALSCAFFCECSIILVPISSSARALQPCRHCRNRDLQARFRRNGVDEPRTSGSGRINVFQNNAKAPVTQFMRWLLF